MAKSKKNTAPSDVYTALLAAASGVVFLTAVFVIFKCYAVFGTFFKIVGS